MPELFGPAGMVLAIFWIVSAHTGYFQGSNVPIKRSNVPCNSCRLSGELVPRKGIPCAHSLRIFLMLP